MTNESILISEVIPATPQRIFSAWMDSAEHSAFTGDEATVVPEVGGEHRAAGGYIKGRTLELSEGTRIVQSWRTTEFPPESPDSRVEITLEPTLGGTLVTLLHTDIPVGQGDRYRQGWNEYYLSRMKSYFADSDQTSSDLAELRGQAGADAGEEGDTEADADTELEIVEVEVAPATRATAKPTGKAAPVKASPATKAQGVKASSKAKAASKPASAKGQAARAPVAKLAAKAVMKATRKPAKAAVRAAAKTVVKKVEKSAARRAVKASARNPIKKTGKVKAASARRPAKSSVKASGKGAGKAKAKAKVAKVKTKAKAKTMTGKGKSSARARR